MVCKLTALLFRMEGYAIARQNGWMSANDIRKLENLNPITDTIGGDEYLVNGNMIPISVCAAQSMIMEEIVKTVPAEDSDPPENEDSTETNDEEVEN